MDLKKYYQEPLGRVIQIISDTELIIDVGEEDITVGDEVIIYALGDLIEDLDKKPLGYFEYDKEVLTVITTTEYYSLCKTERIVKKSPLATLGGISHIMNESYEGYKSMNVFPDQIKPIGIENKEFIQIGDFVKKA